jgi:hypothetical protein
MQNFVTQFGHTITQNALYVPAGDAKKSFMYTDNS